MTKYTDWYPAEIKPVRVGYYQRRYCPTMPDRWDGRFWYVSWPDGTEQIDVSIDIGDGTNDWRGLRSKP